MHPILLTYSFGPPWPWPGMAWGKSRALCFPSMDVGQPAGYVGQYVSPLWGSRYRYWGSGQPTIYIIFRVKWGFNFQSLNQVQVKRYEVGKKYKTIHRKQATPKGSRQLWKKRFFVKPLHKMVAPPPVPLLWSPYLFFFRPFFDRKKRWFWRLIEGCWWVF